MPPIPEVWVIRLAGVAGLLWCASRFRRAGELPNGRPGTAGWRTHTRLSTVAVGVVFLAMLVLSFG